MNKDTVIAALEATAHHTPHLDPTGLAGPALTAWLSHRNDTVTQTPAMVAVVDVAWRTGYTAGARDGHRFSAGFFAAAATRRLGPTMPTSEGPRRGAANAALAADLTPDAVGAYLVQSGWMLEGDLVRDRYRITRSRAASQRRFDEGRTFTAQDRQRMAGPEARMHVVVPQDHTATSYGYRILLVADAIAAAERRDLPAVLRDLAAVGTGLSRDVVRALQAVESTAHVIESRRPWVVDSGPRRTDYATAVGDWTDAHPEGRLAAAVRVGLIHGYAAGHTEAGWAACYRVRASTAALLGTDALDAHSVDGVSVYRWLEKTEVDARWAAEDERRRPAGDNAHTATQPAAASLPATERQRHLRAAASSGPGSAFPPLSVRAGSGVTDAAATDPAVSARQRRGLVR